MQGLNILPAHAKIVLIRLILSKVASILVCLGLTLDLVAILAHTNF
jgi:hypothetical protein